MRTYWMHCEYGTMNSVWLLGWLALQFTWKPSVFINIFISFLEWIKYIVSYMRWQKENKYHKHLFGSVVFFFLLFALLTVHERGDRQRKRECEGKFGMAFGYCRTNTLQIYLYNINTQHMSIVGIRND